MAIIKDVKTREPDFSKTYLLLISPESIPHLAIVSNERYYSLTYKKSIVGEIFLPYFTFLKRTGRKMIFVELDLEDRGELAVAFQSFTNADTHSVTCLNPVKQYALPQSKASFVYELIPELYAAKVIKGAHAINMDYDLNELGEFNLREYTKEAIFSYIQQLNNKNVKREEHILKDA